MMNNFSFKQVFPVLIFFLTIFSCKGQDNIECLDNLEKRLSPKVNEENKIGEVIDIKNDINCFDWDSLIVIATIYLNEKAEKDIGIKLPVKKEVDIWEDDNEATLIFVKDNKVVHSIPQKPTVNKEIFDAAKSIKAYYLLNLLNTYGNGSYYVAIPKEKAVFETYPMVYHDEKGKEVSNPKYGLGIKVK